MIVQASGVARCPESAIVVGRIGNPSWFTASGVASPPRGGSTRGADATPLACIWGLTRPRLPYISTMTLVCLVWAVRLSQMRIVTLMAVMFSFSGTDAAEPGVAQVR